MSKLIILSPDGFPIHPTDTYTEKEIITVFNNWKSRYETQGYYSSVSYGKIPLYELEDYCDVINIEKNERKIN